MTTGTRFVRRSGSESIARESIAFRRKTWACAGTERIRAARHPRKDGARHPSRESSSWTLAGGRQRRLLPAGGLPLPAGHARSGVPLAPVGWARWLRRGSGADECLKDLDHLNRRGRIVHVDHGQRGVASRHFRNRHPALAGVGDRVRVVAPRRRRRSPSAIRDDAHEERERASTPRPRMCAVASSTRGDVRWFSRSSSGRTSSTSRSSIDRQMASSSPRPAKSRADTLELRLCSLGQFGQDPHASDRTRSRAAGASA